MMQNKQEVVKFNGIEIDKISRYGWTVKDQPGELQYLDKEILTVDHTYQRDSVSNGRVKELASAWSWLACGTIVVAQRGNEYYVVDGQHRVIASLRRSDIKKLPCLVFTSDGRVEEAKAFININTNRKGMSTLDKFKALLVANDPTAIKLRDLFNKYGILFDVKDSRKPKSLKTIAPCLTMVEQDKVAFETTLRICSVLCQDHYIHEKLIVGIYYLLTHLSNNDSRFEPRIYQIGAAKCLEGAEKAAAFFSEGGSKVWATGILSAINKGLKNRYTLGDSESTT